MKNTFTQNQIVTMQDLRSLEKRMEKKFVTVDRFERSMTAIAASFNQMQESLNDLTYAMNNGLEIILAKLEKIEKRLDS